MENKITDKLIVDMLKKRGYLNYSDIDENKAWDLLEKYYDCEVSDQWTNKHFGFIAMKKQLQMDIQFI